MCDLGGLKLTKSERILVIGLSYIFTAPLIYAHAKKLWTCLTGLSAEATRQLRAGEENRNREVAHRLDRIRRAREQLEREAAEGG